MSLRVRVILSITVSVMIFLGALYGVSQVLVIKGFEALEHREATANIERVRNAVEEQFNFLESKIVDWGAWDEAYKFVIGQNDGFKEANLPEESPGNLKINDMIYINNKGEFIGVLGYDLEEGKPAPTDDFFFKFLVPGSYLLTHKNPTDVKKAIVITPKGPAFVVSSPVVKADKTEPIGGTLVFSYYLTPSALEHLGKVTKMSLMQKNWSEMSSADALWDAGKALNPENPSVISVVNENKLAGFAQFQDFFGKPALALRIEFSRDIMNEGRHTIKTLLTSIAIFGLLFGIGLLLIIERSVVSRILRLSKRVDEIGKSDNSADRVTVEGKDEITSLSSSINGMLSSLAEKSRAIQTIMDNVDFGLLRCDRSGKILSGYSKSCTALLNSDGNKKLEGQTIWGALGLNPRDSENFQNLFEQVTSDSLLADDLVRQLPSRFAKFDKTLSLFGSVILDAHQEVESVLFTVANITALAKAESENELNQSLLKILNSKDRFGELALRVFSEAEGTGSLAKLLKSGAKPDEVVVQAKRNLHTWKGDFSVFNLRDIAGEIHEIEETAFNMPVIQSGISAISKSLRLFLESHGGLLGLNPNQLEVKQYQISDQSLKGLRDRIQKAANLTDAQQAMDAFTREASYEEAQQFLGHLAGSAVELGKRMGKEVRIEIEGGKIKLPSEYANVYNSLVHLFRNAVDHGLERPGERGAKPSYGTIRIKCFLSDSKYQIEISDDGRGIDLDSVRASAMKKGLVKPEEWEKMTEQQKIRMVFTTGFSTRQDVTQTSGRGIGLDVVGVAVRDAKGKIEVTSKKGKGTYFVIALPELA